MITGSNTVLCQTLDSILTLHCSRSLNCVNEYMARDSGGYLCTNNLRALITEKPMWCSLEQVCQINA